MSELIKVLLSFLLCCVCWFSGYIGIRKFVLSRLLQICSVALKMLMRHIFLQSHFYFFLFLKSHFTVKKKKNH